MSHEEKIERLRTLRGKLEENLADEQMAHQTYHELAGEAEELEVPYGNTTLEGMSSDEGRHHGYLENMMSGVDERIAHEQQESADEEREEHEQREKGESRPQFGDYATPSDEYQAHPNW